jgi:hypothetical protein
VVSSFFFVALSLSGFLFFSNYSRESSFPVSDFIHRFGE